MGANNGTGCPMFFRCAKARHETWRPYLTTTHTITVTGRSKRAPGRTGGSRNSKLSREYVCSCGHTGWSRHIDLERLERATSNADK